MEKFVYDSLPSGRFTRLIQLQPSLDRGGPLHCNIISIDLDKDHESYEAISYTWGPPTFSETIVVHGGTNKAYCLCITPTLSSALLRFRSAWNQRLLWADAVCINQADSADKGRQIPLMSQIYRSALRVLVWLGNSRQAENELKALTHLPRQLRRVKDDIAKIRERSGSSKQHPQDEEDLSLTAIMNVVRAVFEQRWFSRRWIIQEVVFNPDVLLHCGQEEIAWVPLQFVLQDFLALRLSIDGQTVGSFPPFPSLVKMLELWHMHAMRARLPSGKNGLLSLLDHFDNFGCADPRDRIYALAGMADDVNIQLSSPGNPAVRSDGSRFVINTDEQVSAAKLYTALASTIYSRSEHDEGLYYMLSQASSRRSRIPMAGLPELPSWVPDWSSPLQVKMLHFRSQPYLGCERSRKQDPTDAERFSLTANAKVITMRLSPLDAGELVVGQPEESQYLTTLKVTWVSPPFPNGSATSSTRWLVASARKLWQRYMVKGGMWDPENADLRDRFIRTIATALFEEHTQGLPGFPNGVFDPKTLTYYDYKSFENYQHHPEHYDTPRYFAQAVRDFVRGILQTAMAGESIPEVSSDPVFHWINTIMKGRALFTADRNFGRNDAIPGDGVLAFNQHFYEILAPSPIFGDMGELDELVEALDGLDGYGGEARDPTRPSPTQQSMRYSPMMMPSLLGPRKRWRMNSWESIFDMTYLVRVVNRDGSRQDLQEGLCWTLDHADEKASHFLEVGYKLIGECRCAGSIFGSGEQESAGKSEYTCEARDSQGTRHLITWRLEDKHVAMFFV